ncbi:MAG: bifunctional folylpolyglutamate synthase/dihydrofolate synthase, partial [Lentilactobacillus hilgardii]
TVNTLYPDSEKLIINGFLKDKSYESSVKELISLKNASFIITEPDNKQRELPPQQLSDVYVKLTKQTYQSFDSPTDAIQYAVSHATANTIIFVIGSFYLLNPIRTYLLSRSDHHEH